MLAQLAASVLYALVSAAHPVGSDDPEAPYVADVVTLGNYGAVRNPDSDALMACHRTGVEVLGDGWVRCRPELEAAEREAAERERE